MKLVGRVPRASLEGGALVRMHYPPWDVLVTLVDGAPCAIEDSCNHAGASLAEGVRDESGKLIVCPMHGYLFELATGKLVAPLGLCDNQRSFVARVEGDEVVVYDPVNIVIVP